MNKYLLSQKYNLISHLHRRYIKSFVIRQRQLSKKQKYVIDDFWSMLGVDFKNHFINFDKLFNRDAPITLEIGFGTGTSLVNMAKNHPERNFLGVEVYLPGISNCFTLAKLENVKNLRVIYHDAVEVLHEMIPDNTLNIIQLFFPDPWQKNRHKKRRIVQTSFAKLMGKKLVKEGIVKIVTDWEPYAKHIMKVMTSCKEYKNISYKENDISHFITRPLSKFEARSQHLGHKTWELIFKKNL